LSRTTGESATILAIPSDVSGTKVATMSVNFLSIADPIAPRDLGFAIIDSDGKVLFHSDRSRVLVENMLHECPDPRALQSAISRRVPTFLSTDYGASPNRMFVTPLPGLERLPWTLVLYRKLSANRL